MEEITETPTEETGSAPIAPELDAPETGLPQKPVAMPPPTLSNLGHLIGINQSLKRLHSTLKKSNNIEERVNACFSDIGLNHEETPYFQDIFDSKYIIHLLKGIGYKPVMSKEDARFTNGNLSHWKDTRDLAELFVKHFFYISRLAHVFHSSRNGAPEAHYYSDPAYTAYDIALELNMKNRQETDVFTRNSSDLLSISGSSLVAKHMLPSFYHLMCAKISVEEGIAALRERMDPYQVSHFIVMARESINACLRDYEPTLMEDLRRKMRRCVEGKSAEDMRGMLAGIDESSKPTNYYDGKDNLSKLSELKKVIFCAEEGLGIFPPAGEHSHLRSDMAYLAKTFHDAEDALNGRGLYHALQGGANFFFNRLYIFLDRFRMKFHNNISSFGSYASMFDEPYRMFLERGAKIRIGKRRE